MLCYSCDCVVVVVAIRLLFSLILQLHFVQMCVAGRFHCMFYLFLVNARKWAGGSSSFENVVFSLLWTFGFIIVWICVRVFLCVLRSPLLDQFDSQQPRSTKISFWFVFFANRPLDHFEWNQMESSRNGFRKHYDLCVIIDATACTHTHTHSSTSIHHLIIYFNIS